MDHDGPHDGCQLRFPHAHGSNGWLLTVASQIGRRGTVRWSYSMSRQRALYEAYGSAFRYRTAESALAAGRADAEACA